MKTQWVMIAATLGLASACGGTPEVTDPYAALTEGTMLVRFEVNPDIEEGLCNPKVHYAMRTSEEVIFANTNYVVGDNLIGSGINLLNEDESGIAKSTADLSMFDPMPQPCSELELKAQELTCRTADETDASPCPSPKFEGTGMFASFTGLPDY
ncbi:MAG: hypothetical protein AAGB16_08320 [Pseudomonadota bacterium]